MKLDKVSIQVCYEKLIKVLSNVNKMAVMLSIKYKQINLIKSVVDNISAFSGGCYPYLILFHPPSRSF